MVAGDTMSALQPAAQAAVIGIHLLDMTAPRTRMPARTLTAWWLTHASLSMRMRSQIAQPQEDAGCSPAEQ